MQKILMPVFLLFWLLLPPAVAKTHDQAENKSAQSNVSALLAKREYEAAIALLHESVSLYAEQGKSAQQVEALLLIADAQAALNNHQRMLRALETALDVAQRTKLVAQVASIQDRSVTEERDA